MSNLINHADRELKRAGIHGATDPYGNSMVYDAVMELVEKFADQGHSGMSASVVLSLFSKVADFKTLTPITADRDEWTVTSLTSTPLMYQNIRDSSCFTADFKTYYKVDDKMTWFGRHVYRHISNMKLRSWLMHNHRRWVYPEYRL